MTDQRATEELVKPWYPTLAYLGFFIFSVILIVPGSIMGLVATIEPSGMGELSRKDDFFIGMLLLSGFCGMIYLWVAGFLYLQRDRFPASLLFLPAAIILLFCIWYGYREILVAIDSLDQAAPEQRLAYALRARSLGLLSMIPGAVVAGIFCLAAALLAALRALARERMERPRRLGVFIMIFGVAAGLGAPIFLYNLGAVSRTPWVAFTVFVSISAAFYLGLGSLRPPASVRDGANHLLLTCASVGAVALTWLAMALTAVYEPAEVDVLMQQERLSEFANSIMAQREAFRLGVAIMLVALGVSWSTLVAPRAKVFAAVRKARWATGSIAVILAGCVVFAFLARATANDLFRLVSLSDESYFVRTVGEDRIQLPRCTRCRPELGERQTSLIIEPGGVIHVDDQLIPNMEGLSARGPTGYRLRAVLEEKMSYWSMRSDGGEVADLIRSHKTMSEVPWNRGRVTVAIDGRVPFKTVMEATNVLRSLGVRSASLLVSTPNRSDISPEIRRRLGPFTGPLPWEYGSSRVRLRPFQWQVAPSEMEYFLGLRVLANSRGIYIFASGGVLPEGCSVEWGERGPVGPTIPLGPGGCHDEAPFDGPGPPPCAFNYERLRECLIRTKEEYPDERQLTIDASRDVSFEVIVRMMDAAGSGDYEPLWDQIGFPARRRRAEPTRPH